jgi:hypothetical protein
MNTETISYSTLANKIKKSSAFICAWDLDGKGADVITYDRSRESSLHYFLVTDIPQDAMRIIHSPSGRDIVMVRI